jgi:hypothetical protein
MIPFICIAQNSEIHRSLKSTGVCQGLRKGRNEQLCNGRVSVLQDEKSVKIGCIEIWIYVPPNFKMAKITSVYFIVIRIYF